MSAEKENYYPVDIAEAAKKATLELLPKKSRQQYEIAYNNFIDWCKWKKVEGNYDELVFLAYLEEKSKIWNASSLWSKFSMIKSSLLIKNGVDASKYYKVIAFLKRKKEGYRPRKSKVLTFEQVEKFIMEAPDDKFLAIKVATIFGVFGACRREELCNLSVDDIQEAKKTLVVQIPNSKTKISRTFCIVGKYIEYHQKYAALRPSTVNHRRYFLFYLNNKCTVQPIGINTFGKMPTVIAEFLGLPDHKQYTGHCFRRTSASLLAESGAHITEIKKHGGWRSTSVAEGYIDESMSYKNATAQKILPTTTTSTSPVHETSASLQESNGNGICNLTSSNVLQTSLMSKGINVSNCSGCTININVHT